MRTRGQGGLGQEEGGRTEQCWPGGQDPGLHTGSQRACPVGLCTRQSESGPGQLNPAHGSSAMQTPAEYLSKRMTMCKSHRKHRNSGR